jgi:hypothetical protein
MIRAEEERHRLLEEERKKREAEVEERAAAQAAAAMAMCSERQPTDSAREEIRRQVTAILAESAYDAVAMAMSSRGSSPVGSAQSSARGQGGQGGQGSARDDAVWGWSERQPTDSAREEIRRQVTAILAESAYDAVAMAMSSRGSSPVGSAQSSARGQGGQGGQGSARDDAVWGWSERQPTDSAREEIRRQVTAILAESAYDAEAMTMSSRGSSPVGSAQSSARGQGGQGGQGSARDDAVWGWSERQPTDSAREEIRRQVTAILAESAYDAEAMTMSSRGSSPVTHMKGPLMDYPPMPESPSHTRDDLRELSWSSSLSQKSDSLRQRSTGLLLQRSYGSQRSRVLTSASSHGFLHLPLG